MGKLKKGIQNLMLISILSALIMMFISGLTFAKENLPVENARSSVGITFTEKENDYQVIPDNNKTITGNNPGLGGDVSNVAGDNQSGKSIFPQTGEKSTTILMYFGLLIIVILFSYICFKKYKIHRKKE